MIGGCGHGGRGRRRIAETASAGQMPRDRAGRSSLYWVVVVEPKIAVVPPDASDLLRVLEIPHISAAAILTSSSPSTWATRRRSGMPVAIAAGRAARLSVVWPPPFSKTCRLILYIFE
jgi:hypothetical protein